MGKVYMADTNIFMSLENFDKLLEYCGGLIKVPIYVIEELDNLKTKEGDRGFKARRALRNIGKVEDCIIYVTSDETDSWLLPEAWKEDKMDNRIINSVAYSRFILKEDIVLLSNDLNVRIKCNAMEIPTECYTEIAEISNGWTEVCVDNLTYADFLEGKRNRWGLEFNNYLILRDEEGHELRGIYKYLGDKDWLQVLPENIGNIFLGTVSPRDAYQQCAIDSLLKDKFTVITGSAGSGKTLLSLVYALREVRSGARDKLIIFTNPVKARGSEQLGYYTGDRTEKLLQNSIGAMLSSKMGDQLAIDVLMQEGKLEILPISDIRGFEVGPKQIMYITEAQNLSTDLIKLAIQRCAEGAKIILEGDPQTQVDNYAFEGHSNGLRRVIEVFNGYYDFSHVLLPNIYRSQMADKAEEI